MSDRREPGLIRNRGFVLYWAGVVLSQVGVRGTAAVNFFHVYELTRSTAMVGVIGLVQGIAIVTLSPVGGAFADRVDRRRLLRTTQSVSLAASLGLGVLSLAGVIAPWHVYVAVLLNTAASTFDHPARTAIIPASSRPTSWRRRSPWSTPRASWPSSSDRRSGASSSRSAVRRRCTCSTR